MNIVMVNGEKQCGKSTFCQIVVDLLMQSPTNRIAYRYSLVTPIEQYLRLLWSKCPEYDLLNRTTEELKRTKIFGQSGRDWMIALGDAMRSVNEHVLIEMMFSHVRFIESFDGADAERSTLLIENWGFANELIYAKSLLRPQDRIIAVHLNSRASRDYAAGERFDGDNRTSLQHMAGLLNPTPSYLAHLIDPDGGHPSHNQPFEVVTGTNWVPPTV